MVDRRGARSAGRFRASTVVPDMMPPWRCVGCPVRRGRSWFAPSRTACRRTVGFGGRRGSWASDRCICCDGCDATGHGPCGSFPDKTIRSGRTPTPRRCRLSSRLPLSWTAWRPTFAAEPSSWTTTG